MVPTDLPGGVDLPRQRCKQGCMAQSQHISFLLPDLGAGGTERLTIDLMAGMLARGHSVDLVLQRHAGEFLPLVPPGVRIIGLSAPRIRQAIKPLRSYFERERPNVLIAAMWPLTVIAVIANWLAGSPSRVIVADHCSLRQQYAGSRARQAALRASIAASYRYADEIVGVSRGVASELATLAALPQERVTVIHNPIPLPLRSGQDPDQLWQGRPGQRILTVGRLKAQKNHLLLIDAFARLTADREAVLAIVGNGPLQAELERRIASLELGDRILLPGFSATPGDWYAGADLFVLPSDYEGFGNVLVEAMHHGLPIVSTDCPHGPAEVLDGGTYGHLVPVGDARVLAAALAAALDAPPQRERQRRRAAEFSVERALMAYADLVEPA